jgi:hypothetical protein
LVQTRIRRPLETDLLPDSVLSAWAASANLIGTALKLLDLRIFRAAFYPDPSRDHTAAALIYGPIMVVIMIALHKWKSPWWQKIFVLLLLFVCQWGLIQSGVIAIRPGWETAVMLFDLAMFYGCTVIMDKCLQTGRRPSQNK